MSKTIHYAGSASDVSQADRDGLLNELDSWNDPANGNVVVNVSFNYVGGTFGVVARKEDVPVENVSAVINDFATTLSNVQAVDFGTVDAVEEDIRVD